MDRRKMANSLFFVACTFGLILMGILYIFVLQSYEDEILTSIFVLNVVTIVAIFVSYRIKNKVIIKENTNTAVKSIKNIFEKEGLEDLTVDKEFRELIEESEKLHQVILKQDKSRVGMFNIVASVGINTDLQSILLDMLPKISDVVNSNCVAFYLANLATNKLELKHSIGFNKRVFSEFDLNLGEGIIGDISDKKIKIVKDIPDDTIYISHSFLGDIKPKSIMMLPVTNMDVLLGVLVLSSINDYTAENVEQAELIRYYLGIAIGNGVAHETNQRLTSELKFQNKLIQDFNEELENKAEERSILFNNTIDSIEEYAIFSMDKDGVISTWNKGAEKLIGFESEEVIGQNVNIIYPEEDVINGLVKRRMSIAKNEGKYHETFWRNMKSGDRYFAELTLYSIVDSQGEVIGYTSVTRDITPIRDLESALRQEREFSFKIAGYVTEPILFTDKYANIKYANNYAAELFDMNVKEIARINFYDLFTENARVSGEYKKSIDSLSITNIDNLETALNHKTIHCKIVPIQEKLENLSAVIHLFAGNE